MAPPSGPDAHNSASALAHSPSSPPDIQQLPSFDTRFQAPSPYFYFHHIIDPVAATLEVQVLGPDLRFKFTHSRALQRGLSPSQVASSLGRKTVGFVSLLKPRPRGGGDAPGERTGVDREKRIVLAWAESGHGAGRTGDGLDFGHGALANALWTRRVVRMGALLGIKMDRPFDKMGARGQTRDDLRGVFLASHVEVKLAVHAIYTLLSTFKIPLRSRRSRPVHPSRSTLLQLRQARLADGSRPRIEICFSRKACVPCGTFVRKLAALTGVDIKLVWRERLVRVVYDKQRCGGGTGPREEHTEESSVADDDEDADEVQLVEMVDLTPPSQPDVDLMRDTPQVKLEDAADDAEQDDDDAQGEEDSARAAVDAYIDGLAYCVGQSSPTRAHAAAAAVVDLAQRMRRRARAQTLRGVLSKPLPATPETEPPAWMAAATGVRERERRPYGRAIVDGWLDD